MRGLGRPSEDAAERPCPAPLPMRQARGQQIGDQRTEEPDNLGTQSAGRRPFPVGPSGADPLAEVAGLNKLQSAGPGDAFGDGSIIVGAFEVVYEPSSFILTKLGAVWRSDHRDAAWAAFGRGFHVRLDDGPVFQGRSARDVVNDDLRRTFGSLARRAGADLKYIQKAMGHSSITVTAEIYAQLFDSELDQVSDALDALTEGAESAMYAQNAPTGPDPDADRAP